MTSGRNECCWHPLTTCPCRPRELPESIDPSGRHGDQLETPRRRSENISFVSLCLRQLIFANLSTILPESLQNCFCYLFYDVLVNLRIYRFIRHSVSEFRLSIKRTGKISDRNRTKVICS